MPIFQLAKCKYCLSLLILLKGKDLYYDLKSTDLGEQALYDLLGHGCNGA